MKSSLPKMLWLVLAILFCSTSLQAQTITSLSANSGSPTNAASVSWTATFSTTITGINNSNFSIVEGPGLTGASIMSLVPSGLDWIITLDSYSGTGTLRIDFVPNQGETDPMLNPVMNSLMGDTYSIDVDPPTLSGGVVDNPAPNQVILTFDDNMQATDETGWSIEVASVAVGITGFSVSTTDLTFTIDRAVAMGESVEVAYNGTGDTRDDLNNPLASFSLTPITNSVNIPVITGISSPDMDGTFVETNGITIEVTFSENISVTSGPGNLTLGLNSGGTATYLSDNMNVITFSYTVAAGENSADLDVTAFNLGAGMVEDAGMTANADLTLPGGNNLADNKALVIDTTPFITDIDSPDSDASPLGVLSSISIVLTFSEDVIVTNGGDITLNLNSGGVATYVSNATNTITFDYTVASGQNTSDLDVSSVDLGGSGSITDGSNNANLTPPVSTNLADNKTFVVDTPPIITSVTTMTADGTVGTSAIIDVTVNFNENVNFTNASAITLSMNSGGTAVHTGTTMTSISFNYTVVAGENAATLDVSSVNLNTGTIVDTDGTPTAADLTLTGANNLSAAHNITVDTPPILSTITSPSNATFGIGGMIQITTNFSENINVTGGAGMTLSLNSGGTAIHNSTTANTIVFDYTVAAGENSADLSVTAFNLNGGNITDQDGPNDAWVNTLASTTNLDVSNAIVIDTPPIITSVTTTTGDGTVGTSAVVDVTVNFNENVNFTNASAITLSMNSGGTAVHTGTTMTSISFNYTVVAGENAATLDVSSVNLNTGTIVDTDGTPTAADLTLTGSNNLSAAHNITVDTPPILSTITSPSNGTFGIGGMIQITTNFSENINVTGGGSMTLSLNSGGTAIHNSTTANTIVFDYTVAAGENSADLSVTALNLNGGNITDQDGPNDAWVNTLASTTNLDVSNAIVIDTPPIITSVTTMTGDGTVGLSTMIDLTVNFNENVNFTNASAITLTMNSGGTAVHTGTTMTSISFNYTVAAGENAMTLDVSSVNLNTGTILDADGTPTAADLTLTGANNLSAAHNIEVDTPPIIIDVDSPDSDLTPLTVGNSITIDVTFSENVLLTNDADLFLDLNSTGTADNAVVATNVVSFNYTVTSGDDANPLDVTAFNLGASGTVRDGNANNALLTLPGGSNLADNKNFIVNTPPVANSFSPTGSGITVVGLNSGLGVNVGQITFSETIDTGIAGRFITIEKQGVGVVETVEANNTSMISGFGTNVITIHFSSYFEKGFTYFVTVEQGAFEDAGGSGNDQINTWSWTMESLGVPHLIKTIPNNLNGDGPFPISSRIFFIFDEVIRYQNNTESGQDARITITEGSNTDMNFDGVGQTYGANTRVGVEVDPGFSPPPPLNGVNNNSTVDNTGLNDTIIFDLTTASTSGMFTTFQGGSLTYTVDVGDKTFEKESDAASNSNADIGPFSFMFTTVADGTPPLVSSLAPQDDNGIAPPEPLVDPATANLTITFTENVFAGIGNIQLIANTNPDITFLDISADDPSLTYATNTLTIPLAGVTLSGDVEYYVNIDNGAIIDGDGNGFAGFSDETSWNFFIDGALDNTGPQVTNRDPMDNAFNVPVGQNFTLSFDEPINPVAGTFFNLVLFDGDVVVESIETTMLGLNDTDLTVDWSADLSGLTQYYITVDNGAVEDNVAPTANAFNGFTGKTQWNFFSESEAVDPAIVMFTPGDGASGVAVNVTLDIEMSEPVSGIDTRFIRLDNTGAGMDFNIEATDPLVTLNGSNVLVGPLSLESNSTYEVTIDNGAFEDASGNALPAFTPGNWTFTTATDATPPGILTLSPTDDNITVPVGITSFAIEFDEAVTALSGNVELRVAPSDEVIATFVATAGTQVGNTFTYDLDPLDFPSGLQGSTDYYVNIDNTAFEDLSMVPFPGISDNITWNFTTVPDGTDPAAVALIPADGEPLATLDGGLTLQFDEPVFIVPGTPTNTITLTATGVPNVIIPVTDGVQVTGDGTTTITVNPTNELFGGLNYTVTIDPGSFVDAEGNSFNLDPQTGATPWDFTTESGVVVSAPNFQACVGRGFSTQGMTMAFSITETNTDDFRSPANNVTMIFELGPGFEFNPSQSLGSITVTTTGDLSAGDATNISGDGKTVTIEFDIDGTSTIGDVLSVYGLEIQTTEAAPVMNRTLTRIGGTADVYGNQPSHAINHLDLEAIQTVALVPTLTNVTVCRNDAAALLSGNFLADFSLSVTPALNHTVHWYDNNDFTGERLAILGQTAFTGATGFTALGFNNASAGVQTVYVSQVNDLTGCESDLVAVDIEVFERPTADAGPNLGPVCNGTLLELGGTNPGSGTTGVGTYTFLWTTPVAPNQGTISSTTVGNPEITPADNTDFSMNTTRTYTLEVTDGNSCVSTVDNVNVTLFNEVEIATLAADGGTSYLANDNIGTTIRGSLPNAADIGAYTGPGLGPTSQSGTEATVSFIPSAAGVGTQTITYEVTSNATSCTNSSTLNLFVATAGGIFDDGVGNPIPTMSLDAAYCEGEGSATFTPHIADITMAGNTFVRFDARLGGILQPGIMTGSGTGLNSWSFNPPMSLNMGELSRTYTIERVIFDTGLGINRTDGFEELTVFAEPTGAITSLAAEYCEEDAPVTISGSVRQVGSGIADQALTVNGYTVERVSDGATFNVGSGDQLNFSNVAMNLPILSATGEDYMITVTSAPANDPLTMFTPQSDGCSIDVSTTFTLFPTPNTPTISSVVLSSTPLVTFNPIGMDTDFEFCADEVSATETQFTVSGSSGAIFTWYNNAANIGSNSFVFQTQAAGVSTSTATADDLGLDGLTNFTGTFFVTQTTNFGVFAGCENSAANDLEIGITIYRDPDTPELTASASSINIGDDYFYNYCEGTPVENITVDVSGAPLNPGDVFEWYTDMNLTMPLTVADPEGDLVTASELTNGNVDGFNVFNPAMLPATFEYWVQRRENNTGAANGSATFTGCTSDVIKVTIELHQNPTPLKPSAALFDNGDAFFVDEMGNVGEVVKRYICSGENLASIPTPQETDVIYRWYNDNAGALGTEITETGFNGTFVSQANLSLPVGSGPGQGGGGFSNINAGATPIVYSYWVTQVTDSDPAIGYAGCQSSDANIVTQILGATRVDITVFPIPDKPNVVQPLAGALSGSPVIAGILNTPDHIFEYCDGELTSGVVFDLAADMMGNGAIETGATVRWFTADNDAMNDFVINNPTPITTDIQGSGIDGVTAEDLSLDNIAVAGTAEIRYFVVTQTTNENPDGSDFLGCESPRTTVAVVIQPLPDVEFTPGLLLSDYCVDNPVLNITTVRNDGDMLTTVGGVFGAITGLTDNTNGTATYDLLQAVGAGMPTDFLDFDAMGNPVASVSETIAFQFTDQVTGCISNISHNLDINPLPSLTLAPLDASFSFDMAGELQLCEDEQGLLATSTVILLEGRVPTPGTGETGVYTAITGLSTPGVNDGRAVFDPDVAGTDGVRTTHNVEYTFTNSNGCVNNIERTMIVNPDPILTLISAGGCDGDPVDFEVVVNLPPSDFASTFVWDFTDNDIGPSDRTEQNTTTATPTVTYDQGIFGNFDYQVTVTSNNGCITASPTEEILVGDIPEGLLDWDGICEGQDIVFAGEPAEVSAGSITAVIFNFGDGDSRTVPRGDGTFEGTLQTNPTSGNNIFVVPHIYQSAGIFDLTFEIQTNNGCNDLVERDVFVIPTLTPTSENAYVEDFETIDVNQKNGLFVDGWVPDLTLIDENEQFVDANGERTLNTWEFGTTTFVAPFSGSNVWATNLDGSYLNGENSWVFTPCFDLRQLERPMISFYRSYSFSNNRDGAILQYSLDNGLTFIPLGDNSSLDTQGTGVNWYTDEGIISRPGGQGNVDLVGWSNAENQGQTNWVKSSHKLDEIPVAERDAVIFRFAISADGADNDVGFAIDDFFIGERPQTVLLEQFSGAVGNNAGISGAQTDLDQLLDVTTVTGSAGATLLNNNDATLITYKTDLNGSNRVNTSNPSDPNSRVVFYGVETLPTVLINGEQGAETGNLKFSDDRFNQEALGDPDISIALSLPAAADDQIAVDVGMTLNLGTLNNDDLNTRLYIAVVEKTVEDDGMMFRNVMRKLLPDGAGIPLTVNGTDIQSVSQTWNIQRVDDPDNLAVIAFIQNSITKRVLQTAVVDVGDKADVVVTGVGPEILESAEVMVYPNPAHERVSVNFGEQIEEDFDWVIYNQTGVRVGNGRVLQGASEFDIETYDFPSGLYFLRVGNEARRFKHFKVLVNH